MASAWCISLLFFAIPVRALESGTFTEEFSGSWLRQDQNSFAFWDTKNKEVILPVGAGTRDLSAGLKNFQNASVASVATDGSNILAGSMYGALSLISSSGGATDVASAIPKVSQINGLGFISSRNVWVIAGNAKTSDGAMLYTMPQSGSTTTDFQSQAKGAEIDQISKVACFNSGCLLVGTKGWSTRRVMFFDGATIKDVTAGLALGSDSPIYVASSGQEAIVAGIVKEQGANYSVSYKVQVYRYRSGGWDSVYTSGSSVSEPKIAFAWAGSEFLLVKRGTDSSSPFQVFTISGTSAIDITNRFGHYANSSISEFIAGGDGKFLYIAGYVNWNQSVIATLGNGTDLATGQVPILNSASVSAMIPYNGKLLVAGSENGKSMLTEISLTNFAGSAAVESIKVADAWSPTFFKKVTLTTEQETPSGTQIVYFVSGDGGAHFESVEPNREYEMRNQGGDLRYRAVLMTSDTKVTPRIRKIKISYIKDEAVTTWKTDSRDSQRYSDIKSVASALDSFRRDRGMYPIVDGQNPGVRWAQLKGFLVSGKYVSALPNDPKQNEDMDSVYDYISTMDGRAFLMRAKFENSSNTYLASDVDGAPLEAYRFTYTCNDSWYCEGKGFIDTGTLVTTPSPVTSAPSEVYTQPSQSAYTSPSSSTSVVPSLSPERVSSWKEPVESKAARVGSHGSGPPLEVLRDNQGKLWHIVSAQGDLKRIVQQRLLIPSPTIITVLERTHRVVIKPVTKNALTKYPRARLLKTANSPIIYYLTATELKRAIPNWNVFVSYGNDPKQVAIIEPVELSAIADNKLIRQEGDPSIWYLENGKRRLVSNAIIFAQRGFQMNLVAPVNAVEMKSYPIGTPLE